MFYVYNFSLFTQCATSNSTLLASRMSIYMVVLLLLYFSVSILLSKCTEARTLNIEPKTKTKPVVIGKTNNKLRATKNDKNCKHQNKVHVQKANNTTNMEGFISCEYFSDYDSCKERKKFINKIS